MRAALLWDKPTGKPNDRFADVDGVGRYLIKHVSRRGYILKLNGEVLAGTFASGEEAIGYAERDAFRRIQPPLTHPATAS